MQVTLWWCPTDGIQRTYALTKGAKYRLCILCGVKLGVIDAVEENKECGETLENIYVPYTMKE